MGNSHKRFPGNGSSSICLQIQTFIRRKHQEFPQLQEELLEVLEDVGEWLQHRKELTELRQLVGSATSYDTVVPFTELENYIVATLEDGLTNGQEFLKSKRREFFCFARHNLLKDSQFILSKLVRQLNIIARHMLENFNEIPSNAISELMQLANRLIRRVLSWFYGSKLLCGLYPLSNDETCEQRVEQIYLSELSEYILFYEKSEKNYLPRLRFRQINRMTSEVDLQIVETVRDLRKSENPRKESLFPRDNDSSYDVILEYLEKLAHATLLTTKYKFICIILETIPSLFMQSELRRHKQSTAAKRTFCMTPDRKIPNAQLASMTGSFGRCYELENAYSQLLSADNKRDLAKYLLVEWFKRTDMCIIQDVFLPLQLLQRDSYLKDVDRCVPLATFLHALYETIGVEPDLEEFDTLQ